MKKLNKIWRSHGNGGTNGVKLAQKVDFALRAHNLPTGGNKREKIERLGAFFSGHQIPQSKSAKCAPAHKAKPVESGSRKKSSNTFYASWEWKQARYEAMMLHGRQCMLCGFTPTPGCKERLVVDHIKPRSKFPDLALSLSNLQILCNSCNMGKSNRHTHDFRAEWHGHDEPEDDPLTAQFKGIMQ